MNAKILLLMRRDKIETNSKKTKTKTKTKSWLLLCGCSRFIVLDQQQA